MRIILLASLALALAACGDKPAADGSTPAAESTPAAAVKKTDEAAWAKYVPWKSDNPDVKKTGTGVEYVVLASGPAGGVSPTAWQEAEVFYEGRLNAGGPAFDSAFARNESATFPVGAVVKGFSEALQLMKPGDRWLVFLPSDLAYGPSGKGSKIPPDADLVFEIELVKVVS